MMTMTTLRITKIMDRKGQNKVTHNSDSPFRLAKISPICCDREL
jgi:hypothetical protein